MNTSTDQQKLQIASDLHRAGEFEKAREIYTFLIFKNPINFAALHLLGTLEAQCSNFDKAISFLTKALAIKPNFSESLINIGNAFFEINDYEAAANNYEKSLLSNPGNFKIYFNLGVAYYNLKKYNEALYNLDVSTLYDKDSSNAYLFKGKIHSELRNYSDAIDNYLKVKIIEPNNFESTLLLAATKIEVGDYSSAISILDDELLLNENFLEIYLLKIKALCLLGNKEDTLKTIQNYIKLIKNKDDAYKNIGIILTECLDFKGAISYFENAIELNSKCADIFILLANAQLEIGLISQSIINYTKAIEITPDNEKAYFFRGNAKASIGKYEEAFRDYDKAILIEPRFAEAYLNRGYYLLKFEQPLGAITFFDIALSINPKFTEAMVNRAEAYSSIKEEEKALDSFLKALEFNPKAPYVMGKCLGYKLKLCEWSNFSEGLSISKDMLDDQIPAFTPFEILHFFDEPKLHLQAALFSNEHQKFGIKEEYKFNQINSNSRIKIGYFSADLFYHPVSIWLVEQLENHDKTKFELIAFSMRQVNDPMAIRLKNSFDEWIEIDKLSNFEVIKLARETSLDIAIDLNGFTAESRTEIFAARVAPVQISHLGFPGTMGVKFIDYIIADKYSITDNNSKYFTEKIAYIPCANTYDRQRKLSDFQMSRKEFGLPEDGFVFVCQNGCQKFTPEVFEIWMQILKAVPKSVLWLQEPNAVALKNLKRQSEIFGVDNTRLIFTPREVVSIEEEQNRIAKYLSSYQLADLFLDTWPYNAGTTAVDALWAGVPVLTKVGISMSSRMAASPLQQLNMSELVTDTGKGYQELAIEIATNSKKLNKLKAKLKKNKIKSALFDPVTNTKYIEKAYIEMHRRFQAGLKPDDFFINS